MVRKVEVEAFDDLTGEVADQSVVFGVGGRWYELDLTAENAKQVTAQLTRWAKLGREQRRSGLAAPVRTEADRARSAAVRAWAREHGFDVADRGRIGDDIVSAYNSRSEPRTDLVGETNTPATGRAERSAP